MDSSSKSEYETHRVICGRDGQQLELTRLGGSGDVLIILQANGFSGSVYEPLVWPLVIRIRHDHFQMLLVGSTLR